MKNILFLIVLCLGVSLQAQRKPKIKGNRDVTQVREDLPPFNAIELIDELEINLKGARYNSYTVEADDNLIDVLKFKVVDSTLIISSFYTITGKKKLNITINYSRLNGITLKKGSINTDIINSDYLYVNTFGSSKIELGSKTEQMHLNMEDNSSGNFNIDSDSVSVVLKDRVDVDIYSVSEGITMAMQKNADATLEGTAQALHLSLTGNTSLKAQRMEAAKIYASLMESSNAKMYAFEDLELSSKGSSKTYLYGTPKITILQFLDTSELRKEKD